MNDYDYANLTAELNRKDKRIAELEAMLAECADEIEENAPLADGGWRDLVYRSRAALANLGKL